MFSSIKVSTEARPLLDVNMAVGSQIRMPLSAIQLLESTVDAMVKSHRQKRQDGAMVLCMGFEIR